MPTIEVNYKDLCSLTGKKVDLENDLLYVKGELEEEEGDELKIEIADTNRPDLWSTEGIAREIKFREGKYSTLQVNESDRKLLVKEPVRKVRPEISCVIVRDITLSDDMLKQLIQLQEKISEGYGVKRKEIALGVYDLDKIKGDITYTALKDKSFIPLESDKEMTPQEIIKNHEKGKEYGHLLHDLYPFLLDENDNVLSMPPIINSDDTGRVTTKTKNLFIECTGFNKEKLDVAVSILAYALYDRGGTIETIKGKSPSFDYKEIDFDEEYFRTRSGLINADIPDLMKRSGFVYDAKVKYPCYRNDIMHMADIVEDLLITFGYNTIEPQEVEFRTEGSLSPTTKKAMTIRKALIGLNAQEIMNYTLTNRSFLDKNMNIDTDPIEIENPVSSNWSVFRTWLVPGVLEFLSKNTNKEYPQRIYEVGEVVRKAKTETLSENPTKVAFALTSKDADFTDARQMAEFLLDYLGVSYSYKEHTHPSFIEGRCAKISEFGIVGEISPEVLSKWDLKFPVAVFEIDVSKL